MSLKLLRDAVLMGGFAAAARAHDLDPSTVSRVVAEIEREIGVRLLQRTTRRLALTEAGENFLRRAELIVEEYDRARDDAIAMQAQVKGTIRLTASAAYGKTRLVPLLPDLTATYPSLTIELILADENLDLVRDRIDLAIRLAPSLTGDLIASKLHATRYRVCASPSYLQSAPPIRHPEDLRGHQALLLTLPDFRTRWLFKFPGEPLLEVPVQGKILISNAMALRDAAVLGLGPALLADWLIADDLAAGRLVDVLPGYDAAAVSFETAAWLVYPTRAFVPLRVKSVIAFLKDRMHSA